MVILRRARALVAREGLACPVRSTLAAAGGFLLLMGCTTVLEEPAPEGEARPVFLLDHGRHATLVLVRPDGGLVRYAYGDWAYYGCNRTGFGRAAAALLWPTRAGLGRRELAGPAAPEGVRSAVNVPIQALHTVVVARKRSAALQGRLDRVFWEADSTRHLNRWYDLVFVPHPDTYHLFRNSNRRVAAWLKELGVAVRGPAIWSSWRVDEQ
ncbi:hypothetical protein [Thiohalorhabdus sp.]|uniref:hypothetical protein n=1 Tax=Thiohalorhabdus sp. TaxID=3094134 RepID=UPI002FC316AB